MEKQAYPVTQFSGPARYLIWMSGFVLIVGVLGFFLQQQISQAFIANIAINGLILLVFIAAVLYCYRQVFSIYPAVAWVRSLTNAHDFDDLQAPPGLIAPMAVLLAEKPGQLRLASGSSHSILDAVSARMDEAGQITRYLSRLLIFLGLLGTFWGLLQTVSSVGDAVSALSAGSGGQEDVNKLMAALQEPIKGMGTAFSSSLFGLAGSLVIGFLDLQAGQAQNRFFQEVEDWVHSISRVSAAAGRDPGSPAYMAALLEQSAENISALEQVLRGSEERRSDGIEAVRQEIKLLTKTIVGLAKDENRP
ncbi:MotA/TolQ/ExbB proton channel family protein, probably associated with flagella [hydrothermal vent metagenome]|uniref:MotA/TolQ/ExbB proton channel family protein, probably associated with flagella n=1 Tax=hydrothermal vent metagenome TaxID=652676 RepID=A0A3B0R4Y7_9ZZZZ